MQIRQPILDAVAEIQTMRRHIHAHPELSFEEYETAEFVASQLTKWGIPFTKNVGKTGIVATIQGKPGTKSIGLRADMDALPMQEDNVFAHASKNQGKMHACGHDGHTAMLLGAAQYLATHRNFSGTVYLIFQPAEEFGGGAKRMMEDGLFTRFPMDAIFGAHNWPGTPTGTAAIRPGALMASANLFDVVIKGKGTHAALPHLGVDPVMVGVQMIQSWQTIITRNKKPIDNAVISVTQFHAGSANNVVPTEAKLGGTVRTFDVQVLDLIESRMRTIAEHTAALFGAEVEFRFSREYPPTINDAVQSAFATEVFNEILGESNVQGHTEPVMGAEDFGFFLQEKPGAYFFLGNGNGSHRDNGHGLGPCALHNGSYDFNDELLPIGANLWVSLVERWFERFGS